MAEVENTRFYYYKRYKWTAANFQTFQDETYAFVKGLIEGLKGPAVLTGHLYAAQSGFTIGVQSGISVDPNGELLASTGTLTKLLTTPGSGNTRKCLVVARIVSTDGDNIPRPTSPFDTVPLTQTIGMQITSRESAINASTFPAKTSGDTILFGVNLNDTGVSSIDYTQRETGTPRRAKIRAVSSADATITSADEVIEMTTGNTDRAATLPAANTVPNQYFTVVKVDSGTGVVNLSTASGQTQVIDSQYGSVRVYSNGSVFYVA